MQQPTNSPQPTHFLQTPGLPQSTHSSQPAELPQSTHSSQHTKLPQPIHSPQPADLPQPTHSPQHSEFRQSNEFPQGDWADLPEVAFLELADGRLQGVIPSETTPSRVYASSITAGDHGLSCRSNDDLACGGLGERTSCRHIEALLAQAVKEFGAHRVASYLGIEPAAGQDLGNGLHPTPAPSHASEVFSSFLQHMEYLKVPVRQAPPS